MSESLTWLDHIIFAMAPLGIVTAIVGAIRVSGPAWARAFIGRARESRAAAEIELMSSTSREVCEAYNGKGVVRAMGTPKITQFILFPPEYRTGQGTCGIHTLETAYKREQPFLERGKYGINTDWDIFREENRRVDRPDSIALGAGAGSATGVGTNIRMTLDDKNVATKTKALTDKGSALIGLEKGTPSARRRRLWNRRKSKMRDVENPQPLRFYANPEAQPREEQGERDEEDDNKKKEDKDGSNEEKNSGGKSKDGKGKDGEDNNEKDEDRKDEKDKEDKDKLDESEAIQPIFPPELEGSAPNLQLNLPSTIHSHKSTIKDLWCAAVVASLVQVTVLVVSAVTTFHPRTRQAVGRPQTNYGFWLFIAGTLCLDSGMILCSFVIEQSTRESAWRHASSNQDQQLEPKKVDQKTSEGVNTNDPGATEGKARTETLPLTKEKPIARSQRVSASKESRRSDTPNKNHSSIATGESGTSTITGLSKDSTSLQLFWLQQKHTVNDQDFEPFLILGGGKSEILTSSRRLDYETWESIPRWVKKIAANKYELITICASVLGLVGFMLQFEGLRGLAWPTAVSQLLAIFLVALIRAIARRRLGKGPSAIRAHAGHELDCM